MSEWIEHLMGLARRWRPRSESAPGPLEPAGGFLCWNPGPWALDERTED